VCVTLIADREIMNQFTNFKTQNTLHSLHQYSDKFESM
jgi:hypothetical protein